MSWDFTQAQQQQVGALSNQYPFVWLFEVEIPTTPPTRARLAAYTEDITYGASTTGADVVYTAYPFEVSAVQEDNAASLPRLTVSISNEAREVQALVEEYDGLIGQPVVLQLVNVSTLAAGAYRIYEGEVITLTGDAESVAIEVGSYSLSTQLLPSQRALRDYCRHKYKGARCKYTGALPTCDKSLNGADGCEVHSNADRFGGFFSLPDPGAS